MRWALSNGTKKKRNKPHTVHHTEKPDERGGDSEDAALFHPSALSGSNFGVCVDSTLWNFCITQPPALASKVGCLP